MDTFKSYAERILSATPVLLGYRLKPFCLGHSLLLKGANNKFINGDYNSFISLDAIARRLVAEPDVVQEFVFALLVCSTSYDDFKADIQNGEIVKVLKDMVKTAKTQDVDFLKSIHLFAHYLNAGTDAPEYMAKAESSSDINKGSVVSFEEAIISTLMTECGYTRKECLDLPLTETLSAYLLYAHKMGTLSIIGKDEYNLIQRLRKH